MSMKTALASIVQRDKRNRRNGILEQAMRKKDDKIADLEFRILRDALPQAKGRAVVLMRIDENYMRSDMWSITLDVDCHALEYNILRHKQRPCSRHEMATTACDFIKDRLRQVIMSYLPNV